MAAPQQPPARQPAAPGAGAAVAVPAAGTAGAAAAIGTTAAAGVGATVGAGLVVAGLISFLAQLRQMHERWLVQQLGRYSRVPDDIAEVVAEEMRREVEFARRSADRLASALPQALAIKDPQARATAVRKLLEAEQRYAQQRQEAMAARAIAAVKRMQLRRDSPLGAWWRLGQAKNHTPGCELMAGGTHEGDGRFWPWAVLDRVHPPRHTLCTSTLHSFGEAVHNGWMGAGDIPDVRAALRAASGVVMEQEAADALLREFELREGLIKAGFDAEELASRPWVGIDEKEEADGTAAALRAA